MPGISCAVGACAYNARGNCSMDRIHVYGKRATQPQYTGCDSFANKAGGGSLVNAAMGDILTDAAGGNSDTRIGCDAHICAFNRAGQCTAGAIDMGGTYASTRGETECSTFRSDADIQ